MSAAFKPTHYVPFYTLKQVAGSLSLGLVALAGYLITLGGPPKTTWEWFVFTVVALATILKAIQSKRSSSQLPA